MGNKYIDELKAIVSRVFGNKESGNQSFNEKTKEWEAAKEIEFASGWQCFWQELRCLFAKDDD